MRENFDESKAETARKGFRVSSLQQAMIHKMQMRKLEQVRCFNALRWCLHGPRREARVLKAPLKGWLCSGCFVRVKTVTRS